LKRSLICGGRGHGAGRGKILQRRCGVCPLPKKRKGLLPENVLPTTESLR